MSKGFVLDGTLYAWHPLYEIVVGDQIKVERRLSREGKDYTDARTWDDIIAIAKEIDSRPDDAAQKKHPEFKLSLSLAIWAAKRCAGEDVMPVDCMGWVWDDLDFWDDEDLSVGDPEGKEPAAP